MGTRHYRTGGSGPARASQPGHKSTGPEWHLLFSKRSLIELKAWGKIELNTDLFHEMIQYKLTSGEYDADIYKITGDERPPMISIPEYCKKYNRQP